MSTRVFVVDDEKLIADTLVAILQNQGFDATAFYLAETALKACSLSGADMIITDVMMPGMDGVELAIRVRDEFPDCRILLFSGQACTADMLEVARLKGYDFELLNKPVHPSDLLAKVRGHNSNPVRPRVTEMSVSQSA